MRLETREYWYKSGDIVPALLLEIEEKVFNQQVRLALAGKSSEQIINQQLIGDYA